MNMTVALPHPRLLYSASVFLQAARYPEAVSYSLAVLKNCNSARFNHAAHRRGASRRKIEGGAGGTCCRVLAPESLQAVVQAVRSLDICRELGPVMRLLLAAFPTVQITITNVLEIKGGNV